jgi:hypothetical protein
MFLEYVAFMKHAAEHAIETYAVKPDGERVLLLAFNPAQHIPVMFATMSVLTLIILGEERTKQIARERRESFRILRDVVERAGVIEQFEAGVLDENNAAFVM